MINESPTEKLIRELREENERLLKALKAGGMPAEVQERQEEQQQQVGIPEEGLCLKFVRSILSPCLIIACREWYRSGVRSPLAVT